MITEIYKVDQKYFKDKEDAFREALKKNFAVITLNLIEEMKKPTFKINDRVRVIEQPSITGEVIRMDGHKYVIREDDGMDDEGDNTLIFKSEEIELLIN